MDSKEGDHESSFRIGNRIDEADLIDVDGCS